MGARELACYVYVFGVATMLLRALFVPLVPREWQRLFII